MNTLRVGSETWTLGQAKFGKRDSGEWSVRVIDGPLRFGLFGYTTDAGLVAAVEDPADTIEITLDGRVRNLAPFTSSDMDAGAVIRVEAESADSITLSYAGPFLVMNDEDEPEDRPIDVELHITAQRD